MLQAELLSAEREEKGIVDVRMLPITADSRIILWQGDITCLSADAIVNAGNGTLLGCFIHAMVVSIMPFIRPACNCAMSATRS